MNLMLTVTVYLSTVGIFVLPNHFSLPQFHPLHALSVWLFINLDVLLN